MYFFKLRQGLRPDCKTCHYLYSRKQKDQWESDNRVHRNKYYAQWRKDNPDSLKMSQEKFNQKNPDRLHLYYLKNREDILSKSNSYKKNNPLKVRQWAMKRYSLIQSVTVGDVSYDEILNRDGYFCHICKGDVEPWDIHFDHVVPLAKGGSHSMDNISVTHSTCNLRKGSKLLFSII